MKTETALKIVCRIALRVFVFGLVGAMLFGLPLVVLGIIGTTLFGLPGILLFAAFALFWNYLTVPLFILLGIVGLLTWKRRDRVETLQMAVGGFFGGGLIGLILAKGAALVLSMATTFKTFDEIYGLGFIFCGLIGTFYFTLHPKYAPREEPVVVFSDDYLKDEKIEWK